ncbi:MAG TPA: hypothetical protein DCZ72_01705 [Armatimonadetes bacterium]|nr:hypothetical protein [Armatimonadota bacterium]
MTEAAPPATSGPRRGRRLTGAQRRQQLLDLALELFAEHGFDGTTVRDIATAAKVTDGLIYRYFESKEALLAEVVGQARERIQLVRAVNLDQPVEHIMRDLLTAFAQGVRDNLTLVELLRLEFRRPAAARPLANLHEEVLVTLAGLFDSLIERGAIAPHDTACAARLVAALAYGFAAIHRNLDDDQWAVALEQFCPFCVGVILYGTASGDASACPIAAPQT